jgi:hypothetical protein
LNASKLWFEAVYAKLRLPVWAGIIFVGLGPALVLDLASDYILGETPFLSSHRFLYLELPLLLLLVVGGQLVALFVCRQMRNLPNQLGFNIDLRLLYRKGLLATVPIVVVVAITANFLVPFIPGPSLRALFLIVPLIYPFFFLATFVTVLLYSAAIIWREGKSSLMPAHFSFDSMMGFRPFGNIILRISIVYYIFPTGLVLISILSGKSLSDATVVLLLAFLTVWGSVAPVRIAWGLHRKMQEAKRRWVEWIDSLYFFYVNRLESLNPGRTSQNLIASISGLSNLRDEIHDLYEWPFDAKFVVKLGAVVGFMSGIAVIVQFLLRP